MPHDILWAIPSPHLGHPIVNHSHMVSGVLFSIKKNTPFTHYMATSSHHEFSVSVDVSLMYMFSLLILSIVQ